MTETIVLDASGIAVNRTQLDITSWVSAATGPDWGDAEIAAHMADQAVGSSPVDYRLPNRQIKIPLALKTVGGTSFSTIRASLQQKVGLFQREGGWIMRQVGATALYADVVNATLHLGGSWLQAFQNVDIDAVLSLECVPDWYGDEVTLSTHTETALPHLFFTEATINGNYPGRVRVVATNGTTVDQHGLLWGFRSRNYNAGTTAQMFYEAEALTPLSGAAGTAGANFSGGTAIGLGLPVVNAWVPILSTSMLSGTTPLTHTGSYRVWARCFSATGTPQYRFQWGGGALSVPTTNDPIILPGPSLYMLDLGSIRLDAPPVGPNQWVGVVQAQTSIVNSQAAIDCLYFQPLDDGAGKLAYTPTTPVSSITSLANAGSAVDDASAGSLTWFAPGNIVTGVGFTQVVSGGGGLTLSHYLKTTSYGFAIPSSATIIGIAVTIRRQNAGNVGPIQDGRIRLVKTGTIQATDRSLGASWPISGVIDATYGGPTDLWGGSWAPSDINNSGFGAVLAVNIQGNDANVYFMHITIYYTLSSGFTAAPDAVIAASGTAELRSDGMYRQGGGGTIYAPVSSVIGDLPRVPPSGLEARTVQVFLKQSRGNFANEADSAIDDMSAKLIYRPSYLYTT